jgi:ribosomal protein L40E
VFLVKRRGGKSWEVAGGCRKCGLGPLEPKFSKNARTKKNRSKAHISDAPLLYNSSVYDYYSKKYYKL